MQKWAVGLNLNLYHVIFEQRAVLILQYYPKFMQKWGVRLNRTFTQWFALVQFPENI